MACKSCGRDWWTPDSKCPDCPQSEQWHADESKSVETYGMTPLDRRIFRELICNMEVQMETLLDCNELAEYGHGDICPEWKFVGDWRQWADQWLSNLGTPADED